MISEVHARELTLLLVEDDEDYYLLTRLLVREMKGAQYSLKWVSNVTDAEAALVRGEFDAALVDFRLGAVDGLSLIDAARRKGSTRPMILLTGLESDELAERALEAGADAYLVKTTVDSASLERAILTCVG